MFAGPAHPGTTHGQQVGVASLAIARLQAEILAIDKPPRIKPTHIVEAEFIDRYGQEIGMHVLCGGQEEGLRPEGRRRLQRASSRDCGRSCARSCSPSRWTRARWRRRSGAAGGPTTATELGLPRKIWRDAMKYARDVRNRWSFLDLADDAGLLDDFLAARRAIGTRDEYRWHRFQSRMSSRTMATSRLSMASTSTSRTAPSSCCSGPRAAASRHCCA